MSNSPSPSRSLDNNPSLQQQNHSPTLSELDRLRGSTTSSLQTEDKPPPSESFHDTGNTASFQPLPTDPSPSSSLEQFLLDPARPRTPPGTEAAPQPPPFVDPLDSEVAHITSYPTTTVTAAYTLTSAPGKASDPKSPKPKSEPSSPTLKVIHPSPNLIKSDPLLGASHLLHTSFQDNCYTTLYASVVGSSFDITVPFLTADDRAFVDNHFTLIPARYHLLIVYLQQAYADRSELRAFLQAITSQYPFIQLLLDKRSQLLTFADDKLHYLLDELDQQVQVSQCILDKLESGLDKSRLCFSDRNSLLRDLRLCVDRQFGLALEIFTYLRAALALSYTITTSDLDWSSPSSDSSVKTTSSSPLPSSFEQLLTTIKDSVPEDNIPPAYRLPPDFTGPTESHSFFFTEHDALDGFYLLRAGNPYALRPRGANNRAIIPQRGPGALPGANIPNQIPNPQAQPVQQVHPALPAANANPAGAAGNINILPAGNINAINPANPPVHANPAQAPALNPAIPAINNPNPAAPAVNPNLPAPVVNPQNPVVNIPQANPNPPLPAVPANLNPRVVLQPLNMANVNNNPPNRQLQDIIDDFRTFLLNQRTNNDQVRRDARRYEMFPKSTFTGDKTVLAKTHWQAFEKYYTVQNDNGCLVTVPQILDAFQSTLSDNAYSWFQSVRPHITDKDDLGKKFLARYNKWGQTQREFASAWSILRFKSGSQSVEEFCDDCKTLGALLGLTDAQILEKFKQGFTPHIEAQLLDVLVLQEAVEKARLLCGVYHSSANDTSPSGSVMQHASSEPFSNNDTSTFQPPVNKFHKASATNKTTQKGSLPQPNGANHIARPKPPFSNNTPFSQRSSSSFGPRQGRNYNNSSRQNSSTRPHTFPSSSFNNNNRQRDNNRQFNPFPRSFNNGNFQTRGNFRRFQRPSNYNSGPRWPQSQSRSWPPHNNRRGNRFGSSPRFNNRPTIQCSYCRGRGHYLHQCQDWHDQIQYMSESVQQEDLQNNTPSQDNDGF